jgi:hypothetical protein
MSLTTSISGLKNIVKSSADTPDANAKDEWPFPYDTKTDIDPTQGPDIETIHDSIPESSFMNPLYIPPKI